MLYNLNSKHVEIAELGQNLWSKTKPEESLPSLNKLNTGCGT